MRRGMPPRAPARDVVIVAGDFVLTGGMDRANYAVAEYLSGQGHRVELVAHRVARELAALPGVSFRRVPKPLDSYMLGEPLLDHLGRRAVSAGCARGGVGLVNGGNVIVTSVNWVHYVHAAYEPRERGIVRGVRRRLYHQSALRRERAALRLATSVIANSQATKRALIDLVGVPEERIHVVYYGMDPGLFTPTTADTAAEARLRLGFANRPLVAFVGALGDQRKGFDTLFEAWRLLCRMPSWDADLIAMGGGNELPRFRARARELGLDSRIRLLGFRSDVSELLGACDALVSPTRYEAYGIAVAEALARGLPALVSRAAGVAEIYPAELSELLLDDPDSPGDLAKKLLYWREHFDTQRARVRPVSERVRARTWNDMAAEIARYLAEARRD
jgi:glycosyltransferase involved in cell wall biosynthesis